MSTNTSINLNNNNKNISTMNERERKAMERLLAVLGGNYSDKEHESIANGDDSQGEVGILHTWFVDAPSAMFSGQEVGTRWEILVMTEDEATHLLDGYDDFEANGDKALNFTAALAVGETEMWFRIW